MKTFEELKTLKVKDTNLSQKDFYTVIRDRLEEQSETDEVLEKGFGYGEELEFEQRLADAIYKIYDSPTYFKRATMQLAFNQALKEARLVAKNIEYEQSLVIVDEFVGCFVGGQDWTGVADKNGVPMKQDLVFLAKMTDEETGEKITQFRVVNIFGSSPVKDWDEAIEIGSWYNVGLVEKLAKNGNIYINVGTFAKVSSDGLPVLTELLTEVADSIFLPSEGDIFQYIVVKGQIRNIAPIPVWDDDMTKPIIHLKDRQGAFMYDDEGNKEMGYPQAVVGYLNLKQPNLQGKGEVHTMYIRLQDDDFELEDEDEDVFFEARFNNQHFGKVTVNLDFEGFLDDDDDDDDDPEELASLISDHMSKTPILAVVKMTSYQPDKNNDKLTWIRSNGIYIEKA